jgi:Pentapeptide repeats (8 copies)
VSDRVGRQPQRTGKSLEDVMPESVDPSEYDAGPTETGQAGDRAQDVSSSSVGDQGGYPWIPPPGPEEYAGPVEHPEPLRGDVASGRRRPSMIDTADDTGQAKPGRPRSAPPRRRDQLLWLWPVGVLLLMVLASYLWGSLGVFITATIAIGTLALFVGDTVLGNVLRVCIAAAAVLLAAGALIGYSKNYSLFSTKQPRTAVAADKLNKNNQVINLEGKRVTLAELKGRNLHGALLAGADLSGLDLHGMNLNGIIAPGASFRRAILDRASLIDADLRGTDLSRSCLHGAILTGAQLEGANAAHADVTNVKVDTTATRQAAVWPSTKTGTFAANCG